MGRFNLLHLIGGLQRSKKPDYSKLQDFLHKELEIASENTAVYAQAFRHVTAVRNNAESNERLEFIGDAILDAVVASLVFDRYPDRDEGFLSKIKSAVVNRQTLNKLARDMHLEKWVEAKVNNRQAMHVIGGNALEALIGAIFKDKGFDYTRNWVEAHIVKKLDLQKLALSLKDPKSILYEESHRQNASLEFDVVPLHSDPNPPFKATVIWNGETVSSAEASSKKIAEQKAARKALSIIIPS